MPAYGNPLLQQNQRTPSWKLQFGTGRGTGRTGIPITSSFGGLAGYDFLQDRSRPAFRDPRIPFGMGQSAEEAARRGMAAGLVYRPDLGGFVPANMYTQTMGTRGAGTVPNVQPQPPQMTDQQMEWARKAQAGKSGSDVLGKMGEKMTRASGAMGMGGFGGMGAALGAGIANAATQAIPATRETPTFVSGGNPYANTRAQNFQNAVDAGEVLNTIGDFNRQNAGTGYSMGGPNTMGRISYNPYANTLGREQLQGQIDAKRAAEMAARGEGAVQRFNAQGAQANISPEMERGGFRQTSGSAFKVNPYGTATATFGERKGPGMVKDELTGKMVPISQAVADMKAVQATKGIDPETGAPLDEKETKKAQEGFLASRGKGGKSKVA